MLFSGLEGEYDYVRVLNRALPDDIRVTGWSPVPIDFHARSVPYSTLETTEYFANCYWMLHAYLFCFPGYYRFSCSAREYKYFFWRQNLDLSVQ